MISFLMKLLIGPDVGGRMFLTIISGLCFMWLVVTGAIKSGEAMLTIGVVFALYFSRSDRNQGAPRA